MGGSSKRMTQSSFSEAFEAVKQAAERQRVQEWSGDLRNALAQFSKLPDCDPVAVADALSGISSPAGAGCLAVWLGACVENGRDPDQTCRQIVETFLKWSRTVETLPEEEEAETEDDQAEERHEPTPDPETIVGMQFLGQALVAHLARSQKMRGWAAGTEEIYREFQRVEHLSYGAAWVMALLNQQSGTLVVLN